MKTNIVPVHYGRVSLLPVCGKLLPVCGKLFEK